MADFIHAREYLNTGDVVILDCDTQCNFMLMTDSEFNNYKRGSGFRYCGGHFKMFPAKIPVPHHDNWNVVLDLGGGGASIRYKITYIKR